MNCNGNLERKESIKSSSNSGSTPSRLSLSFGRLPRISSKPNLHHAPPMPSAIRPAKSRKNLYSEIFHFQFLSSCYTKWNSIQKRNANESTQKALVCINFKFFIHV